MNFIKNVHFSLFGADLAHDMKPLSQCTGITRLKIVLMKQYRNGVPVAYPSDLKRVQELKMLKGCQDVVVQQTAKLVIRQICGSRGLRPLPFTQEQVYYFAKMLREEICKEREPEVKVNPEVEGGGEIGVKRARPRAPREVSERVDAER
jgi:hypothetical protein